MEYDWTIGHVLKHVDELLHTIIVEKININRDRGRSKTSYIKKVIFDAGLTSYKEFKRSSGTRNVWRNDGKLEN